MGHGHGILPVGLATKYCSVLYDGDSFSRCVCFFLHIRIVADVAALARQIRLERHGCGRG